MVQNKSMRKKLPQYGFHFMVQGVVLEPELGELLSGKFQIDTHSQDISWGVRGLAGHLRGSHT